MFQTNKVIIPNHTWFLKHVYDVYSQICTGLLPSFSLLQADQTNIIVRLPALYMKAVAIKLRLSG